MEHAGSGRLSLYAKRLAHHALKGEQWSRRRGISISPVGGLSLKRDARAASASTRPRSAPWTNREKVRTLTLKFDVYLELATARTEYGELEGYKDLLAKADALDTE